MTVKKEEDVLNERVTTPFLLMKKISRPGQKQLSSEGFWPLRACFCVNCLLEWKKNLIEQYPKF